MTDTPKDKRATALERIKALAEQRGAAKRPGGDPKTASGQAHPKEAPKHGGGPSHRPQGG